VVFGAGSVGRGFLGQLFSESSYEVVFVDVVEPLLQALNSGAYTLRLSGVAVTEELTIHSVRAVDGRDLERVAQEVASATVLATAVGARVLPAIAKPIAAGLTRRWTGGVSDPINIIICENLHDAPDLLRGYVLDSLEEELRHNVDEQVGFVPAVIARMSPVPTAEQQAADPALIVAEPYKVLPVDREAFVGDIPDVIGMEPVSPFDAYVERKLYIHNASHAMLGYLGYQRGYEFGYEAVADPLIYRLVRGALDESVEALVAEHGFGRAELREHVQDLLTRFRNQVLGDPVARLARDPLRKLAPDDRLVGAARLAEKHGIQPLGLAWGIAAALLYDNPADPIAVTLQAKVGALGVRKVLDEVCHIRDGEMLGDLVVDHLDALNTGRVWQSQ